MVIQIDTRQKALPHNLNIESFIRNNGIEVVKSKMLVGDYMIPCRGNVVVDTKQNMLELYSDLVAEHHRFAKECQLAKQCDIKLYILVANDCGINNLDGVIGWKNPLIKNYNYRRDYAIEVGAKVPNPPTKNETLIKIMKTMSERYGVEFLFCDDAEVGKRLSNC